MGQRPTLCLELNHIGFVDKKNKILYFGPEVSVCPFTTPDYQLDKEVLWAGTKLTVTISLMMLVF